MSHFTENTNLLTTAAVTLHRHINILSELGKLFHTAGYQLYLVGGSVRDALLGLDSSDFDCTTDATPDQIQQIIDPWAEAQWATGIEFGTIGLTKAGYRIEITTFRTDCYDGLSRNPTVQFGKSLYEDLIRRDFTINAMAVELTPAGLGEFLDPLSGLKALDNHLIDTPTTPEESFHDDPLRMLRAARFMAQLNFTIAPRVTQAIRLMARQLERITPERINVELDKLLCSAYPIAGINLFVNTGMGAIVFPELGAMRMTIDEHHQHKDVYQHSLTVLTQAIDLEDHGPDLILRWAALLHDIGKPVTRKHEANGKVSFHHHEVVGAKMARRRMRALKYPKHVIDEVSTLIYLHLRFHGYKEGKWTDSAVRRYVNDAGPLLPRLNKLVRADCTTRNKRRAAQLRASYDQLEQRIDQLAKQEDLQRIRPALDGNEIMELLAIPPGPQVGEAWNFLKELRLEQGIVDKHYATEQLLQWWRTTQDHH